MSFEERLGLLVEREADEHDRRLKVTALRHVACVEDADLRTPRGLDRAAFAHLIDGGWIGRGEDLLITGASCLGKSWLACPPFSNTAIAVRASSSRRPIVNPQRTTRRNLTRPRRHLVNLGVALRPQ